MVRDFIFVEDLAEALVAAARDQSSERIFNIGSGQGLSLLQIVAAIEHELGTKLEIDWKPGRAVDVPVSVVSIKRAECLLGWKPRTPFASGLRRTIAWWRSRSV